jgi:hypothetical protein
LKLFAAITNSAHACASPQLTHAEVWKPMIACTEDPVGSLHPAPQFDGMDSPEGETATPPLPSAPY